MRLYSKYYYLKTNLGLPFGILSLLNYLSQSRQRHAGIEDRIGVQMDRLLKILDNNKQKSGDDVFYPALNGNKTHCRMAWCYGELTIAYQLLSVAERIGDDKMRADAIQVALGSVKRSSLDDTMIIDPCLQQGACGLYLLYYHMYKKTNDIAFHTASNYWQNMAINILERNNFMMWERHKYTLYNNHSLLEGLAGIGLSLLSPAGRWTSVMLF